MKGGKWLPAPTFLQSRLWYLWGKNGKPSTGTVQAYGWAIWDANQAQEAEKVDDSDALLAASLKTPQAEEEATLQEEGVLVVPWGGGRGGVSSALKGFRSRASRVG